ncbi:MAG: MFS transporter [Streptosporangiales bacterium]|nr:MFS transporter [Streptosporangiales bacterium]
MRVLLAAAENIDNPASSSLLADYYPPVNRPKVFGWVRITTYLGGLGTMAGGVLGQALGWRSAFMIMVVPGILVAIVAWFLREPPRGLLDRIVAGGSTEPVPMPASGPSANGKAGGKPAGMAARLPNRQFWPQLKAVLRIPTLLLVGIALAVHTIGVAGVFFWLPSLMVRNFDQSLASAASLSGLITVVGVVAGTALGSFLGPRAHARFKGGLLMTGGAGIAIGASILFLSLRMPTIGAYTAVLMVSCTLMSVAIPTCTAAIADTIGAKSRGIGFALVQFLLTLGTSLGPLTVGALSDSTGSLLTAISILVTPMVIGGLCTVILGRRFYDRDAARVMAEARAETPDS